MSGNLYEIVTLKILKALEQGVVPWRKPWKDQTMLPVSAVSNKAYRGVNVLLLGLSPFSDHRWITFKQAEELGGRVKPGEKGSMVVFWKQWQKKDEDEEKPPRSIPVLKYFTAFNAEQCEGLGLPPLPQLGHLTDAHRISRADALIDSIPRPPFIEEIGDEAWYLPSQDLIRIPKLASFDSIDAYYSVKFHELGHSTGHTSRLNRSGVMERVHFGSEDYSREELVAELTAAFCCATVGIDNTVETDSAPYIHSWMKALRNDPKAIVTAAAQAQKATDYIKGIEYSAA
jgi:antirestriction protein ArdC